MKVIVQLGFMVTIVIKLADVKTTHHVIRRLENAFVRSAGVDPTAQSLANMGLMELAVRRSVRILVMVSFSDSLLKVQIIQSYTR